MRKLLLVFFYLNAGGLYAQDPKLVLPVSHSYEIKYAVFSPDNKLILTVADGGKIWDVASGRLLTNIRKLDYGAKFSADGKKIFFGAKAWDVFTGEEIINLSGHILAANYPDLISKHETRDSNHKHIAKLWDELKGSLWYDNKYGQVKMGDSEFSGSGTKLISGNMKLIVWNAVTGDSLFEIKSDHKGDVFTAQFSPDESRIFATSLKEARILDAVTGKVLKKITGLSGRATFSNNGKLLIRNNTVWNIAEKKPVVSLKWNIRGPVLSYQFSPDDKFILSILNGKDTAVLFDAATGKRLYVLPYRNNIYSGYFFSLDNKTLITGMTAWNLLNGKKILDFKSSGKGSQSFSALSPNGKIIAAGFYLTNFAQLYRVDSNRPFSTLKGHTTNVNSAIFSPDGKRIVTVAENDFIKIWDAGTGNLVKNLNFPSKGKISATYSPDRTKLLLVSSIDNIGRVVNADNYDLIYELKGHRFGIVSAAFSPNGKKIVTASRDKTVKIWGAATGEFMIDIGNTEAGMVNYVSFLPGSEIITTGSYEGMVKMWNTNTGEFVRDISNNLGVVEFLSFSPDNTKIAVVTMGGFCEVKNLETGKDLYHLDGMVETVCFSNDGKKLLTGHNNSLLKLYDAATGKIEKEIISPGKRAAFFSSDNKRIITAAGGEMIEIYTYPDINLIYRFLPVDTADYFLQLPSQYFLTTAAAAKLLHYVTKDLKIISFEQLDVKYNRPDKVLEAIGSTDTALIKSYRKAYEKRIKKLGIDTTAFRDGYSVPEADFVNRDIIEFQQRNGKMKLVIKSVDSIYKLDRFNIWVNETPLYGQRGISLLNQNKNSFDSTITIDLSQGENKIETSITNVNGTESYRMPLLVNYTPAVKQKEQTYFIGIGIDKFNDSKYNLRFSTKDIRDLSKKLKEKYNDIIIDTLFNEQVTISNVKALKQKLLQTSVNDKVIISYSGHGMLSKDFDYYLSTYAVNFDKPEENGLPYDELESLLDSIPARKKLMLIDACHSGEVDKDDLIAMNELDSSKIKRGLKPVAYKKDGQLGLKNSFELMQSLFVNVGKSTGATIISAAAGTQFALEGVDNLPNGVFTYCILEAMKKYPTMKISELKKTVGERVVEITKGLQKPTSRNETITVDWEVWSK
ncbi:MAG: caspase family protein [Ferruginibacter sp.]